MRMKIVGTPRSVRIYADLEGDWVEVLHRAAGEAFEITVTPGDLEPLIADYAEVVRETAEMVAADEEGDE